MFQKNIVSNISIQDIKQDPQERVNWVEHELTIKKLPKNKGLAEFKKEFGSKGLKIWSDSYINDNFPELRKYVDLNKSKSAKLHHSKKITAPSLVKRLFGSRLTKNEKKLVDDMIKKNQSNILIDSITEFLASKKENKNDN